MLDNLGHFTLKNPGGPDISKYSAGRSSTSFYISFHYTEWDAQASEPQGLLFGNRYQLGNFDQCMNSPWAKKQPELKTKYCLAEIVLERTDKNVRRKVEKPYYPYQSALDFIEVRLPFFSFTL